MGRYTVSVLVRNQFGVLNRVTSMFRRRQFNISALSVSETESADFSRITVVFAGEELAKQQLINQLYKLPDVCAIRELAAAEAVCCELLLLKLQDDPAAADEMLRTAEDFGALIVDRTAGMLILRLADTPERIDEFVDRMRTHSILEICRTGSISLEKGRATLREAADG